MPVDVDSLAIAAISGKIWNVVTPIELYNLANDGVERAIHHKARHIPFRHPQLFRPGTFCGHPLLLSFGTRQRSAEPLVGACREARRLATLARGSSSIIPCHHRAFCPTYV